jgi:hypothetical protein
MDNNPDASIGFAIGFLLTLLYELYKQHQSK